PGSANPISGGIVAMKTFGRRVDDMIIKAVGVKFALGENPKTVYNDKNSTPVTRMATAALIREALFKAKKYSEDLKEAEENPELEKPEFDIKCEALIPLIRRKVKAHFHCHRADDIFTAIRISKEFDLDCVLVHTTEGHLIGDLLGKERISAIVGPIICDRSKPEMKNLSTKNAAELWKSGVKISLCTDHPVIPAQYLPMSAAVAVKGGLPFDAAIKALTIDAAEIIGISERVGSIEVGKDADFSLFDGNPLDVMVSPKAVIVDGKIIIGLKK
ncbi:MAG: amidohydrolase family protein, partial [Oscillospiraceae bacterium]